jgi:uncharacterized membrane protein YhhN
VDALWLVVASAFALGDWFAVATRRKWLEYVCKPAVMVALAGLRPPGWIVVALVFSLFGDVFLMLPRDLFVPGLASFLLAHVAYTIGFHSFAVWALVVVVIAAAVLAPPILRAADRELRAPVAVYMIAIVAMVTSALASGHALAAVGAALFFASDATIAWNRFVAPKRWAPLFIIVTYHVGQAGLVLSLAR